MYSEKPDNIINIHSKKDLNKKYISSITTSTANFISEDLNSNIPNSESNFLSTEKEEKNNKNSKKKLSILKYK